jgi:hypothetical protein
MIGSEHSAKEDVMELRRIKALGRVAGFMGVFAMGVGAAWAIDVKLSVEEAQKALETGRIPMEKANLPEDVKKVLQQAS